MNDGFTPRSYHCSRLDKAYYRATVAHREYRTILIESGTGINISPQDLAGLDKLVSPLILQGQSPCMILKIILKSLTPKKLFTITLNPEL